jgi:hypothetical protein
LPFEIYSEEGLDLSIKSRIGMRKYRRMYTAGAYYVILSFVF